MPNTFSTASDPSLYLELTAVDISGNKVAPRPASGFPVAVQNFLTGVRLADTATVDDNGSLNIVAGDDCPLIALSLNTTTPVFNVGPFLSKEARVTGATLGTLVASANTAAAAAQSAATSAASAASSAANDAANKIPTSAAGTSIAQLATTGDPEDIGRIPRSQIPAEVLAASDAFRDGEIGGGGTYPVRWRFTAGQLADNVQGEWFRVHGAQQIAFPPSVRLDAAGSTPTIYTLEKRATGSGTVVEMYSPGSRPTLAAGQVAGDASMPTTVTVEDGEIRVTAIDVPPAPGGSSTAAAVLGQGSYNSLATTATTHSPSLPSGGTTGAQVVMFVSSQAPTVTMGSAWTKRADQQSDPTTVQSRLTVWTAEWTSSLAMGITLSASSPVAAHVVILAPVSAATPITDLETRTDGNAHGASTTTPSKVASAAADLTFAFASIRYAANIDGHHVTTTSGPAGLTEVCDEVTTRSATTNVGLYVGRGTAVAAAATIPAATLTASGGTGALTGVTWCSGVLTISRAPSSSGPTVMTVQVDLKVAS